MLKIITVAISLFWMSTPFAAKLSVEHFARFGQYDNVVISPTGEYLAVEMTTKEGKGVVAVLDSKTLAILSHIPAGTKESPINPVWLNDTRLAVSFTRDFSNLAAESLTGQLLAFNFDGSLKKRIISLSSSVTYGDTKRLNSLIGYATIEHLLPADERHIIIRLQPWGRNSYGEKSNIYKLNVYNGRAQFITESPSNYAGYVFSASGELTFAIGLDKSAADIKNTGVIHQFKNSSWQELAELNLGDDVQKYTVIGVTAQTNKVYIEASYSNSTDKVFLYDLDTGSKKIVFHHPIVDASKYVFDKNTNDLLSVYFDASYPDVHIINADHAESKWLPVLFSSFPGDTVHITSTSKDNKLMLAQVQSATKPKRFYIVDTVKKSINLLLNSQSWVDPKQMAEVKAINFKARDGVSLHGYLTLPSGEKDNTALIVMPHGGPHGPRDYWRYNAEVQFFASLGYAVLQVNFRGSGGYGLGFEESGYRQWGGKIQQDIIDATLWAQKQENISNDKACILGASFGGYSALMAPTIAQKLYKCAIGLVGVYDLVQLYEAGDIQDSRYGQNYLAKVIGKEARELAKFSPVAQVEKIELPLLLIHGEKDNRAHFSHYEILAAALTKHNKKFDSLIFDKEGHGIATEANRAIYFKRIASFLATHLN